MVGASGLLGFLLRIQSRESQATWADLPAKGKSYCRLRRPHCLCSLPAQMWFAGSARPVPLRSPRHAQCPMLLHSPRLIHSLRAQHGEGGLRTIGLVTPLPLKLCPISVLSRWQPELASTRSSTSWGSLSWRAWRTSPCRGSATAGRSRAET